jgi:hypothetical protein
MNPLHVQEAAEWVTQAACQRSVGCDSISIPDWLRLHLPHLLAQGIATYLQFQAEVEFNRLRVVTPSDDDSVSPS